MSSWHEYLIMSHLYCNLYFFFSRIHSNATIECRIDLWCECTFIQSSCQFQSITWTLSIYKFYILILISPVFSPFHSFHYAGTTCIAQKHRYSISGLMQLLLLLLLLLFLVFEINRKMYWNEFSVPYFAHFNCLFECMRACVHYFKFVSNANLCWSMTQIIVTNK